MVRSLAALPTARDFRAALIAGNTVKAKELAKGRQYAGYRMTIFSNSEETVIEDQTLHAKMYFHMVDALEAAGEIVSTSAVDFERMWERTALLIKGQNQRSDHLVGDTPVRALDRARVAPTWGVDATETSHLALSRP